MTIDEIASRENRRKDAFKEMNGIHKITNIVDMIFVKNGDLVIGLFQINELVKTSSEFIIEGTSIVLKKDVFTKAFSDCGKNPIMISKNFNYPKHEIRVSLPIQGMIHLTLSEDSPVIKVINDWLNQICKYK